jgi:hypothetical protein
LDAPKEAAGDFMLELVSHFLDFTIEELTSNKVHVVHGYSLFDGLLCPRPAIYCDRSLHFNTQ